MFTSVAADSMISATVTGASGLTTCYVDESENLTYPIISKSLTIVYAYCE